MTLTVPVTYDLLQKTSQEATPFGACLREALAIVEQALDQFGPNALAVSFNGGKDCTVLLELYSAALQHRYPRTLATIVATYVTHAHPFPEVEAFVAQAVQRYGLDLVRTQGPIKPGLFAFIAQRPLTKAILVGTRRDDPHGAHMPVFAPTDPGWPSFVRVNPVINWSFNDVWAFLRRFDVPYCALYDQGFTSLGDRTTTLPNQLLANPRSPTGYDPAWTLTDCSYERQGRAGPVNETKSL
ncbi:FAD1 flavin adenine dinucleotide synthetase [Dimargaris xerosporica]|nr:FAD1 flavin adenine dinucleotide synthetase [Dimargaris xerosporica]